jgi:hypothetical protein
MIIKNERERWVGCSLCGEKTELSHAEVADPATVLMYLQLMRLDHKPCEEFSLNPERARIERVYRVGMRAAMADLVPLRAEPPIALSTASAPSY